MTRRHRITRSEQLKRGHVNSEEQRQGKVKSNLVEQIVRQDPTKNDKLYKFETHSPIFVWDFWAREYGIIAAESSGAGPFCSDDLSLLLPYGQVIRHLVPCTGDGTFFLFLKF